ncbi:MAG: MBL fold metallo-hydrolase [Clostridiales bacterium]|nr:MBL fold metallo-hydrolase [Clostridiales bacterium]
MAGRWETMTPEGMCDWMMTERFPNIDEILLTSSFAGMSRVRVFLIPGKNGGRSLMIDAGFRSADSRERLERALAQRGISCDSLDIFLTHKHSDHCGQAEYFARKGARIFLNSQEEAHAYNCMCCNLKKEAVDEMETVLRFMGITPERQPGLHQFYHDFNHKAQERDWLLMVDDFPYDKISEGELLEYGDYCFETVRLKGHTSGQLGLYDRERNILFCADQLMEGLTPVVPTAFPDERLLSGYFASLAWIRKESEKSRIIPSHGRDIADPGRTVDQTRENYMDKIQVVRAILAREKRQMTVAEATSLFLGRDRLPESDREWMRLRTANAMVFSCLEYLHDTGLADRINENGILYWRTT